MERANRWPAHGIDNQSAGPINGKKPNSGGDTFYR
jgi:hypothetical protein